MDAELRTLERAAIAGGARERLAWARGLERAGRGEEGVAALLPVRDDAAVRAHLQTLPSWPTTEGPPSGTRFLDARPVARPPVERWRTTISMWPGSPILASPLAIVTREERAVTVLDPRTGASRGLSETWWLGWFEGLHLGRLVLRVIGDREISVDVLAGTSRPVERRQKWSLRDAGIVIRSNGEDVRASMPARRGVGERRLWRRVDLGAVVGRSLGPKSVGVVGDGTFAVFDRRTGATIAAGLGDQIVVDAHAFVVRRGNGVLGCDAKGLVMWAHPLRADPCVRAVAPGFVLAGEGDRTVTLDRLTGRVLGAMDESTRPLGVVGDVIYVSRSAPRGEYCLEALRPGGETLWSIETPRRADAFAALDARVYYGVSADGGRTRDIVCLAEAPGEGPG